MRARDSIRLARWTSLLGFVAAGVPLGFVLAAPRDYPWSHSVNVIIALCPVAAASILPAWFSFPHIVRTYSPRARANASLMTATVFLMCVLFGASNESWLWVAIGLLVVPALVMALLLTPSSEHAHGGPASTNAKYASALAVTLAGGLVIATGFASYACVSSARSGSSALELGAQVPATVPLSHHKHAAESAHFRFATNLALPLAQLVAVAEDTRRRTRTWLRLPSERDRRPSRLDIYLCRDKEELLDLERRLRGPHAVDPRQRPWFFGGYYGDVPMIAIVDMPGRRSESLAHEVVHSVIASVTHHCPDVISEGVACYLSEKFVGAGGRDRAYLAQLRTSRSEALAGALEQQRIPPLREMFRLDHRRFHREQDGLNYDLAWCLVRVLDRSQDSQTVPKLPLLIRELDFVMEPWDLFESLYSTDEVENLWGAEIRRVAESADEDH